MKLKEGFVTYKTGTKYVAVSEDDDNDVLNGMVRNNETAEFIFEKLMRETTEEEIAAALIAEYDVSQDVAAADVNRIVSQWRDEGLLDE